jgi:hypothetical protein
MAAPPGALRTGLVGEVADDAARETTDTVLALMRVFMRDALVVAGRYTLARRRRRVGGRDMRAALMYCARTFFERDDAALARAVADEARAMADESDGESEASESEASEGESGESEDAAAEPTPADLALATHVDRIVATWPLWAPTDPVHVLIKEAIDRTPV